MCDSRPKYSDELPGCQLFFLTKLKSDCTLGLLPAGVNYTDTPAYVRGTFCLPFGVRFVRSLAAYVFYTPRLLSKNKIDGGIACKCGGTPGGPCVPTRTAYFCRFFLSQDHLAEVPPAPQNVPAE